MKENYTFTETATKNTVWCFTSFTTMILTIWIGLAHYVCNKKVWIVVVSVLNTCTCFSFILFYFSFLSLHVIFVEDMILSLIENHKFHLFRVKFFLKYFHCTVKYRLKLFVEDHIYTLYVQLSINKCVYDILRFTHFIRFDLPYHPI